MGKVGFMVFLESGRDPELEDIAHLEEERQAGGVSMETSRRVG